MGAEFRSEKEFRTVMDRIFSMMSEDPEMGPKLRDADVPQRFEFTDLDLVVNIRAAREGEDGNLHWEWSDDVDWDPKVKMAMSSETANQYFQGKENVAMALARAADQVGRRREGRPQPDPDHEADLRPLQGVRGERVSAPGRLIVSARSRRLTRQDSRARPCRTRTRQ